MFNGRSLITEAPTSNNRGVDMKKISGKSIKELCNQVGLDPEQVYEIHILPRSVTFKAFTRADGKFHIIGTGRDSNIAKSKIEIGINWSDSL